MNVLKFLIIIVLIAAKSEQLTSTIEPLAAAPSPAPACVLPKPECYRNKNGFCRTFGPECDANNGICSMNKPTKHWTITNSTDCAKRTRNQIKCCHDDCQHFVSANCTGKPVCASSLSMQKCRLFKSTCDMKKVSCKDRKLKDWRVAANKTACYGLKPNAAAVKCTVLN